MLGRILALPDGRWRAWARVFAVVPGLVLFVACGSGAKPAAQSTPTAARVTIAAATGTPTATTAAPPAATAASTAAATPAAGAAGTAPAVRSPQAGAPVATGTPVLPVITLTPPPPIVSTPCKVGQIKGDNRTKSFYLPGMTGYSSLTSNVQCFNSPDDAKGAGFHLPGQ